MSLAALKKKSQAKTGLSRGQQGFSTVGTVRTGRPIGAHQRNSSVRTIMKGNTARGHGGSRGSYPTVSLSNERICTTRVAPQPCFNTSAYLSLKTCTPQWYADSQPLVYRDHNTKLRVNNSCGTPPPQEEGEHCCENARIGSRVINRNTYHHEDSGAIPAGEYTETILLRNKCLPAPPCKAPFPPSPSPRPCQTDSLTPTDAIAAGLLPRNWMACTGTYPGSTGSIYARNPYASASDDVG